MDKIVPPEIRSTIINELALYQAAHGFSRTILKEREVPKAIPFSSNPHIADIVRQNRDSDLTNKTFNQIVDIKIDQVRLKTVECYKAVLSRQTRLGKNLHSTYKKEIEANRERKYWLYGVKTAGHIMEEQAILTQKLPQFQTEKLHEIEISPWQERLKNYRDICDSYHGINKAMSETLKENKKFKDDLWRASAARWSIAIAIVVAALGQSGNAIENVRTFLAWCSQFIAMLPGNQAPL